MPTLNPKITNAGLALFPSPDTQGFQVALTHVALGTGKYAPTGAETALQAEVARYQIGSGTTPSATSVQVGVLITNTDDQGHSPNGYEIGEIGFYAGSTLFAVWSQSGNFLFKKAADFDVPMAYTLDVSTLPASSVTVTVNASKEGLESFILAHEAKVDPHPQYVQEKIGIGKYDALTVYDLDARVIGDDGKTYRSLAANNVGFTPSTNAVKWARWGHTVAEMHSEFIPTKVGVQVNGSTTNGLVRVNHPDGAYYAGSSSVTGALKFAFPAASVGLNSMVRLRVEIFNYAAQESITLLISGYVQATLAWGNHTVTILGEKAERDFPVRFGNDGTKPCIWIGELATIWKYPRVYISEVMATYNVDGGTVARWSSGWAISTVTAFDTVEDTITGNLVFGQSDIANVAGLQSALDGKEPTISVGTTAQYWRGDKSWRDLFSDVRAATLAGLSTATNAAIAATDTVLGALGKLQKQITDLTTTVGGKEPTISVGTTAQYWRGDKSWRDLFSDVRAATLTGLSTATGTALAATDTVLAAFGKLQKQITDLTTTVGSKEPAISVGTTAQYWRGDKTWSDLFADVRAATLTGLSTATNAVITATDTVLVALGKLQKQITDLATTVGGKEPTITGGTTSQFWRGDKSWQDLFTSVRAATLTGLSTVTGTALAATDTVLAAFGKLQKQITDLTTTVGGKAIKGANNDITSLSAIGLGTTAAPSIAVGAANTGLYAPAAGQVGITTNGTVAVSFDAAGKATFVNDVTMPILRLTATGDASETSTLHAIQIGPTAGLNVVFDDNEIMARNNGALASLGINQATCFAPPDGDSSNRVVSSAWVTGFFSSGRAKAFTANGTFTVPTGVTKVWLTGVGGGGGGGAGGGATTANIGGGGAGGAAGQCTFQQEVTVTPGTSIAVTIGAGGSGGTSVSGASGNDGTAGGNTTFGALATLVGGGAGGGGASSVATGAGGAGAASASNAHNGAAGSCGNDAKSGGTGGAGASSPFGGGGGAGRGASSNGVNGYAAGGWGAGGGGGGGAYGNTATFTGGTGGAGTPGILIVEW